jgi:hypothetical protein
LKRAPFLGATAAALLPGCSGTHFMRALPGVAAFNKSRPSGQVRLIPDVADTIPDYVLQRPIVGELRRFDGTVAPPGWLICSGQTINIAENPHLFAILRTSAGGDGKTTFKLPSSRTTIIAAGGVFPATPAVFTQSGRHMTHTDSLGEGARAQPPRMPKPASEKLLADRRLISQAVAVRRVPVVPVSPEMAARMKDAHAVARTNAIDCLSPGNKASLESALQAAVAGRVSVDGAVRDMASRLTIGEAEALLQVNDTMIRQFNDRWPGSPRDNIQIDAANVLFSVAITREQNRAIVARERSLEIR